jgi:hypothetical protein
LGGRSSRDAAAVLARRGCRIRSCPSPSSGPSAGLRRARPCWCRASSRSRDSLAPPADGRQVVLEIGGELALQSISGLILSRPCASVCRSRSAAGRAGRAWKPLRPVKLASKWPAAPFPAASPCGSRSSHRDRRTSAGRFRPLPPAPRHRGSGCQIGQAEPLDQLVAVGQRFGEMLAGFEEQHRHRRVDWRPDAAAPRFPRRSWRPPRGRPPAHRGAPLRSISSVGARNMRLSRTASCSVKRGAVSSGRGCGLFARSASGFMALGPDRRAAVGGRLIDVGHVAKAASASASSSGWSGAKLSKPQRRMWLSWSTSTAPTARSSPV